MIKWLGVVSLVALLLVRAFAGGVQQSAPATKPPAFAPVASDRLHNAHVVIPGKLISGAQPEDDAAFAALHDLGVRTIISVDGARPDVAAARKYDIRSVHLPIGYDTVTPEQGREIAKALDELPGPIYLHCHHGKHRSAAAVAVACVYNGSLQPAQAESVLETFGTGKNYKGLWKSARDARPLDAGTLVALRFEYVETAKVGQLAEMMVAADHHLEHLKLMQKSRWHVPPDHPDLDPDHEALQLEEHLREAARLESTKARPAEFRTMLTSSESATRKLGELFSTDPVDAAAADNAFTAVSASCTACHTSYRD